MMRNSIAITFISIFMAGCAHISLPTFTGECPWSFPVKGNADSSLYHTPESPYYTRTNAELCFDTESAARQGGFLPVRH